MRATATGAAGGGVAAAAAASEYAIVTAAQTEARNVREAARVAAQALSAAAQNGATQVSAQAVREAATARREAADVLARARLEAQQMVMRAGEEAARLRHQARTQASEAQRAPLGGRSMLIVFFHGELAAATNDFAEENQIGGGGFGGVFCARRVRGFGDGVELAVKRLDADSRQGQKEFLQEVQVLGACKHENLLPLIGFSADNTTPDARVCLVFPRMLGGSLQDRLFDAPNHGRAPLTWTERVRISVGVAEALQYLHTPDPATHKPAILHRDIKPANVLLDADGLVKLADVGLAKVQVEEEGRTHMSVTHVAGTSGFMDPNYIQTGHYAADSDAFALGVTVLILLTGTPAMVGGSTVFDRCEGQEPLHILDVQAGWPEEHATAMLRVGLGLADPRRRKRMQIPDALAALSRIAASSDEGNAGGNGGAEVLERQCLICLVAPRTVRLACGHSTYCHDCLLIAKAHADPKCPYCRAPVESSWAGVRAGEERIAHENTFVRPVPGGGG